MTRRQRSSTSLLTLLLCLCLGSLAILPMLQGPGFSMTMVASSGEPADYLEQAEVVEDDLLMAMGGKEIATGLSPSKCSLAQLRFWSALFSPQTPPPKSAESNRF